MPGWRSGTDLRDDNTGIYTWPHHSFECPDEDRHHFVSVTTVLDQFSGSMRFAEHWFSAEYVTALGLLAMEKAEIGIWCDSAGDDGLGGMVAVMARDVLTNNLDPQLFGKNGAMHHLKGAGAREMTKRANRGSVVHDCIEDWAHGMRMDDSDLPDYVGALISGRGFAIPVDYCLEFAQQALAWCERHVADVEMAEAPVFSFQYHYAGTLDLICTLRGIPGILPHEKCAIDAKNSKDWQITHGMQQAAYFYAEQVGIKNTNQMMPMPKCDRLFNLYIQPTGCTLKEWEDPQGQFDAFLYARMVWQHTMAKESPKTIKCPKGIKRPTPDQMTMGGLV